MIWYDVTFTCYFNPHPTALIRTRGFLSLSLSLGHSHHPQILPFSQSQFPIPVLPPFYTTIKPPHHNPPPPSSPPIANSNPISDKIDHVSLLLPLRSRTHPRRFLQGRILQRACPCPLPRPCECCRADAFVGCRCRFQFEREDVEWGSWGWDFWAV